MALVSDEMGWEWYSKVSFEIRSLACSEDMLCTITATLLAYPHHNSLEGMILVQCIKVLRCEGGLIEKSNSQCLLLSSLSGFFHSIIVVVVVITVAVRV
jgi:hypothetical protein